MDRDDIFIGGRWCRPSTDQRCDVFFSFDNSRVGSVPFASFGDIDRAVEAARRAFDSGPWPRMTPEDRIAVLSRFAELHAERCDEFARFISGENASPLWFTRAVQQGVAVQNAAYLAAAREYPWELRRPSFGGHGETVWRREPVGVVAAIIPWNAPHQSALTKLFPALLAGCPVILKLAPETALDAQDLGEMMMEAGLPEDVLSILVADREVSEYLAVHPGVDKIAFTGSTGAGQRIAELAGKQLKRVGLELGGKSATVLLPDADLPAVAKSIRYSAMINTGQSCVAQTRVLVPRGRQAELVEALVADIGSATIGDPRHDSAFFGPLVAERQRERVARHIEKGIAEGAKVALGGSGMPAGIEHGAFVRPTIFHDVDNAMSIAQEEIFGPVLCVIPYDSEDDAARIANDTPYGLGGAVWSAEPERALGFARRIRTGTISINGAHPDFSAPFGGFGHSGIGREFGSAGLDAYVEHKAITI
ncbi:aldehyde dehydrogenase [Croceicoccus sp. BE223]|uniref:aldehyde dehydrogenase n=1 Tax=Croceicoccus sp. BE223 TaxID=2817716 RepID=UPI002869F867|nr:aldehyde dehydrogenase [Croceicoccus sp. BE223]